MLTSNVQLYLYHPNDLNLDNDIYNIIVKLSSYLHNVTKRRTRLLLINNMILHGFGELDLHSRQANLIARDIISGSHKSDLVNELI